MAQDGYYKGSDGKSFHVRYYVTEIVDGQPKRVQRSHKLCEKNRATGHADDHHTKSLQKADHTCRVPSRHGRLSESLTR